MVVTGRHFRDQRTGGTEMFTTVAFTKKEGKAPEVTMLTDKIIAKDEDCIRLAFGAVALTMTPAEALSLGNELRELATDAKAVNTKLNSPKPKSAPAALQGK